MGWESQCSGVGLVGSWDLRVFGLLRAGIVDQQIWALQGMMWINAVQQITGKPWGSFQVTCPQPESCVSP